MATELAKRQNGMTQMDIATDWTVLKEQAAMLVSTGFLPASIKTPEQAIAIVLKGRELGLPMMYSLSNISIINGKPCTGAEAIAALIYRDQGDNALMFTETTDERCTVKYKRRSWPEHQEFTFSADDAKKAGLFGKGTWSQYPKTMLRWRAISAVGKFAFADTVGGLYNLEEMGAEIKFDAAGEMEVVLPEQKAIEPPYCEAETPSKFIGAQIASAIDAADLKAVWDSLTPTEHDEHREAFAARKESLKQQQRELDETSF